MRVLLTLFLFLLAACTTLKDISPPREKMYLTVTDDISYSAEIGIPRKKHLIGTTKGRFNLVGEDKAGYYFIAENSTHFVITDENMKYYEEHKSLPDGYVNKFRYGIWYPKTNINKSPHFFLILKADYENAAKQGGAVNVLTAAAVDGAIVDGGDIDRGILDPAIKIESDPT